jgi:oligopeptide transport system ATP-binding protein
LARALIIDPNIVICDEPVSALDVSIQAQILNLLMKLQKNLRLTMIFITHDISVVRHISNRIGVMYLGNIVEEALTDDLFINPLHPYTKALFSAVPDFLKDPNQKSRKILKGEIPSNAMQITGCPFHHRCPDATDFCVAEKPTMRELEPQHFVSCHYAELGR